MARTNLESPGFVAAVRAYYRPENLPKGMAVTGVGPQFLFVLESEATPTLMIDSLPYAMSRLGGTNLWAKYTILETGEPHEFHYMSGREKSDAARRYSSRMVRTPYEKAGSAAGEDQREDDATPARSILEDDDRVHWVYEPPNYDGKKPLPVMVWQDGYVFAVRLGVCRLAVVTENLNRAEEDSADDPRADFARNGGREKDAQHRVIRHRWTAAYARFLREDILPEVEKVAAAPRSL